MCGDLRSHGGASGPQRPVAGHGSHPQVNERHLLLCSAATTSKGTAFHSALLASALQWSSCSVFRSFRPSPLRVCSPDYKLSISSLENGQEYRFTVRVSGAAAPNDCIS